MTEYLNVLRQPCALRIVSPSSRVRSPLEGGKLISQPHVNIITEKENFFKSFLLQHLKTPIAILQVVVKLLSI